MWKNKSSDAVCFINFVPYLADVTTLSLTTMKEVQNSTSTSPQHPVDFLPWSDPRNIVSYQAYLDTLFYYNNIFKPLVVTAGIATNIVNCLVFRRQGLKDRMNLCLFVHALVDMTYLVSSLAFNVTYWIKLLQPVPGEELYRKTHCYAMGVCAGFREASACINAVIAVERCVCVVFPLMANSLMSTKAMGIMLVAIVIGMQLAFATNPIKRYVYPVYDNTTGMTMWQMARSAAWQDNEALLLYDTVDDTIMMIIFPFVIFALVSGVTTITVVKLRAAMSWRRKASSRGNHAQPQQVALTKMLVLASCIFVACKVPVIAFTMGRVVYPEFSPFGSQHNAFRIADLIAPYFPYAHCAVSFFVYYSLSSRFRSELQGLCGCSRATTVPERSPETPGAWKIPTENVNQSLKILPSEFFTKTITFLWK
ncbi:neuromedin-U receptor 2-like [Pomacea canaliculata]|uniref:neuromedin-U receptor 2-like n=1 Tax=Pomacea canaliculata TaxID=400727 RepID=UPI000D73678E|nr:neuromedin-U receptor 2-like [Pomacea canaliculata]